MNFENQIIESPLEKAKRLKVEKETKDNNLYQQKKEAEVLDMTEKLNRKQDLENELREIDERIDSSSVEAHETRDTMKEAKLDQDPEFSGEYKTTISEVAGTLNELRNKRNQIRTELDEINFYIEDKNIVLQKQYQEELKTKIDNVYNELKSKYDNEPNSYIREDALMDIDINSKVLKNAKSSSFSLQSYEGKLNPEKVKIFEDIIELSKETVEKSIMARRAFEDRKQGRKEAGLKEWVYNGDNTETKETSELTKKFNDAKLEHDIKNTEELILKLKLLKADGEKYEDIDKLKTFIAFVENIEEYESLKDKIPYSKEEIINLKAKAKEKGWEYGYKWKK